MDRLVGWCEVDEHAGVQGKDWGKWGGGGHLKYLTNFVGLFTMGKFMQSLYICITWYIITTMTNSCCK